MANTTISDWIKGYPSPDSNTPIGSTVVPAPPTNNNNALSERLRDLKAVLSQEARNKGWQPDALPATRVSTVQFTLASSIAAIYPLGTAIKLDLGSGVKAVVYMTNVSGTTVTVRPASVTVGLVSATFSAILPKSTPIRQAKGYPKDIGSPLPPRISQRGLFQIAGAATSVTVPLMTTERDSSYKVFLQSMSASGGTPGAAAYRVLDITRTASSFTITLDGAPGVGPTVTMLWEFAITRGA